MSNKDEIDEFIKEATSYDYDRLSEKETKELELKLSKQLILLKEKWQSESRFDELKKLRNIYISRSESFAAIETYYITRLNQLNGDKR